MKKFFIELKRIVFDLTISIILIILYLTGFYEHFNPPVQIVFLKMLLVSMGFVHCHIIRKITFGKIDWDNKEITAKKILIIALYIIFIYAYSQGG